MIRGRLDGDPDGLIHHSDRGSQGGLNRSLQRLADAGIDPSTGSVGDSFDNAMAETINGLYKTELIHRRGPWRGLDDVEYATLEWVDWFNHHRILEPIGDTPPAEYEANYYRQTNPARDAGLKPNSLRWTRTGSPFDDVHYMTTDEIARYQLTTE